MTIIKSESTKERYPDEKRAREKWQKENEELKQKHDNLFRILVNLNKK